MTIAPNDSQACSRDLGASMKSSVQFWAHQMEQKYSGSFLLNFEGQYIYSHTDSQID